VIVPLWAHGLAWDEVPLSLCENEIQQDVHAGRIESAERWVTLLCALMEWRHLQKARPEPQTIGTA
jgi:hypothetical protein